MIRFYLPTIKRKMVNILIWIKKRDIYFFKNLTNRLQNNNGYQVDSTNSYQYVSQPENLIAEIPVALVYNGISHTVMMCSPKNLKDFAIGFSLAEEIIQSPQEIYGIDIIESCAGIEVHLEIATRCFVALKERRRSMVGRTGCGICGSERLKNVIKHPAPLKKTLRFNLTLLDHCLTQLQEGQVLRAETGASHAAAFFSEDGQCLALREDVGRHIALDKLLGWHAQNGRPQGFVLVSSRASYEMVQKTATCGIEMLIAVSASTHLAVQLAEECGLTLIGFARQGRASIYHDENRCYFNS